MSREKQTILIVDDTLDNIDILKDLLKTDYRVKVALNGEKALKISMSDDPPDIILLDIMMPGMSGHEVCEKLKSDSDTKNIPVIFLTALAEESDESKGLKLGAVDYITKPFNSDIVRVRVANHLKLKRHSDNLEELVRERTRELELTQEATIASMGILAEYRDPETGGHINRTQTYVKTLAEALRDHPKFRDFFSGQEVIGLLYKSAPLHDIGKVGVSDSILLKPGKLTSEEFEQMKLHSKFGRDAIAAVEKNFDENSFLRFARKIAYSHHEKWNGSGYPEGLKGDDIPISGRLMAIADVYDALISKRVYKPPFPHKKAVQIIFEDRGEHFDPDIVDVFMEIKDEFRKTALKFADYDEEREMLLKKD